MRSSKGTVTTRQAKAFDRCAWSAAVRPASVNRVAIEARGAILSAAPSRTHAREREFRFIAERWCRYSGCGAGPVT